MRKHALSAPAALGWVSLLPLLLSASFPLERNSTGTHLHSLLPSPPSPRPGASSTAMVASSLTHSHRATQKEEGGRERAGKWK
eukprot:2031947-Rhodomonas_salina.1